MEIFPGDDSFVSQVGEYCKIQTPKKQENHLFAFSEMNEQVFENFNLWRDEMSFSRLAVCALLMAACTFVMAEQASAQGSHAQPRQYYSGWKKHPSHDYYYRSYYYKPSPNYSGYKHHYAVYSQNKPKHIYYYNPYKKAYWGRCYAGYDSTYSGKPLYSLLKPEHRQPNLIDIPEAHFPEFGGLPPIPGSDDGVLLDLPPDDLPGAF